MDRAALEKGLAAVGEEAMHCEKMCEGVRRVEAQCTPTTQSVISGSGSVIGCVVIGLTPVRKRWAATYGQGNLPRGIDGARIPTSFSRLRDFCAELGVKGTFVWMPLCKCERIKGEKLPRETMEACALKLLTKELELIKRSAPIIALGNRVFDTVRQCFPNRFVLNVPNPDGSRSDFQKTIDNSKILDLAKRQVVANKPGALCLCPSCARKYFAKESAR
jgi:hypothetical protein